MTEAVTDDQSVVPNDDTQSTVTQRPDDIPEKFWDAEKGAVNTEALLKSYVELEKASSKPKEVEPPPVDPNVVLPTPPNASEEYTKAVEKATAELASESGAISEETYADFAKQGITREQIDTYVQGQIDRFELRKYQAEREYGGEQEYADALAWAGANYSAEEAEAFNNAVFGADKAKALEAVRGLKSRYEDNMGTEGRIVTNGTSAAPHNGYKSKAEWLKDVGSKEYKNDPAFREQVRVKLEAALKAGVDLGVSISGG